MAEKLNGIFEARMRVQTLFTKAGGLFNSRYPLEVESQSLPLLKAAVSEAMKLTYNFCTSTNLSYEQLKGIARNRLEHFAQNVSNVIGEANQQASGVRLTAGLNMSEVTRRCFKEVKDGFQDFEIGFIGRKPITMNEADTITGKSLIALKELYDAGAAAIPQLVMRLASPGVRT